MVRTGWGACAQPLMPAKHTTSKGWGLPYAWTNCSCACMATVFRPTGGVCCPIPAALQLCMWFCWLWFEQVVCCSPAALRSAGRSGWVTGDPVCVPVPFRTSLLRLFIVLIHWDCNLWHARPGVNKATEHRVLTFAFYSFNAAFLKKKNYLGPIPILPLHVKG